MSGCICNKRRGRWNGEKVVWTCQDCGAELPEPEPVDWLVTGAPTIIPDSLGSAAHFNTGIGEQIDSRSDLKRLREERGLERVEVGKPGSSDDARREAWDQRNKEKRRQASEKFWSKYPKKGLEQFAAERRAITIREGTAK